MSELTEVLGKLQKTFGVHIGGVGGKFVAVDRIPTGIFQFDLATGGGFPMGRMSEVYGSESSGKTTVCLKAIAFVQKVLKQKAVLIDVENTYDPIWAATCGVLVDELVVLKPDTAEQVVDLVEALLCVDEVGIIVLDSVAAMATHNEIVSDSTKQIVGGSALLCSKMTHKAVAALSRERARGHYPAFVCVNQIRIKIGVSFGDPETTPGGNSLRFAFSLRVRLWGKDLLKKDGSLPHLKEVNGIVRKWKVPVMSRNFKYEMVLLPHKGLKVTETDSWNTVAARLKQYGALVKGEKSGWLCMGVEYGTIAELESVFRSNEDIRLALQQEVVKLSMADLIAPQLANGEDDVEVIESD